MRLRETMDRCRAENRAALIVYLCAGDPDPERTVDLVCGAATAGADIVELGMPFSDPTADGPVIQRASARALAAGMTVPRLLETLGAIRKRSSVPILLFGYYNPLLAFGEARVVDAAHDAGADGFLVVDLPPEEAKPLAEPCERRGLAFVPLLAPTSTPDREALAAELASGFVYYVSMTGITGGDAANLGEAAERAGALSNRIDRPVAMGFGIKTPADVREVSRHTDGVVVGSALVTRVFENPDRPVEALSEAVSALAGATRRD